MGRKKGSKNKFTSSKSTPTRTRKTKKSTTVTASIEKRERKRETREVEAEEATSPSSTWSKASLLQLLLRAAGWTVLEVTDSPRPLPYITVLLQYSRAPPPTAHLPPPPVLRLELPLVLLTTGTTAGVECYKDGEAVSWEAVSALLCIMSGRQSKWPMVKEGSTTAWTLGEDSSRGKSHEAPQRAADEEEITTTIATTNMEVEEEQSLATPQDSTREGKLKRKREEEEEREIETEKSTKITLNCVSTSPPPPSSPTRGHGLQDFFSTSPTPSLILYSSSIPSGSTATTTNTKIGVNDRISFFKRVRENGESMAKGLERIRRSHHNKKKQGGGGGERRTALYDVLFSSSQGSRSSSLLPSNPANRSSILPSVEEEENDVVLKERQALEKLLVASFRTEEKEDHEKDHSVTPLRGDTLAAAISSLQEHYFKQCYGDDGDANDGTEERRPNPLEECDGATHNRTLLLFLTNSGLVDIHRLGGVSQEFPYRRNNTSVYHQNPISSPCPSPDLAFPLRSRPAYFSPVTADTLQKAQQNINTTTAATVSVGASENRVVTVYEDGIPRAGVVPIPNTFRYHQKETQQLFRTFGHRAPSTKREDNGGGGDGDDDGDDGGVYPLEQGNELVTFINPKVLPKLTHVEQLQREVDTYTRNLLPHAFSSRPAFSTTSKLNIDVVLNKSTGIKAVPMPQVEWSYRY